MRLKYGLSSENPVRELSTITDEKSSIGYNMKPIELLTRREIRQSLAKAERQFACCFA